MSNSMDQIARNITVGGVETEPNRDKNLSPSNTHDLDCLVSTRPSQMNGDSPYPVLLAAANARHDSSVDEGVNEKYPSASDTPKSNTNACVNPLVLIPHDELEEKALEFARTSGLYEDADIIRKGALVAKDPFAFDSLPQLSADEKAELHYEQAHRWDQPKTLYNLVAMCAFAAIIQGMADSTSYIAAEFWPEQFGLSWDKKLDVWIINFTMMAPYLSTAAIGCWLSDPMNRRLGRRRTVFITAALSFLFSFWQAATKSLPHLIVARLILGLGLGISSSTVPMYTAECVPTHIRGALVMTWQAWIAFGSALGYATTLAMYHIIHRLSWRLMLASICVPAFLVMAQIYTCPESPRWLIQKARYPQAFSSLCRLRKSKLAAARDLYYIHALLEIEKVDEEDEPSGRFRIVNLFTIPRNRRAALASFVIMFMQQFCGANIIDFLSYDIFRMAGLDRKQSIAGLCAYWMLTFLSILPAAYTIDTFGRRFLLLATFPGMCISMLAIGIACFFEDIPTAMRFAAAAVYLFAISYSSGEGAVSFTYPAEAFPLDVREIGVGFATATGAIFNFLLGFTIPRMSDTFTLPGAFMWFAGWNVIGWVMTFLFVPETMGRSLEELDEVFSVPTRKHASYQLREASIWFNRRIRGKDVEPQPLLYSYNGPKTYAQLDVEQVLRAASSNQGLF